MRKLMILLIALSTAAGLAACGNDSGAVARSVGNQRATDALWDGGAPDAITRSEAEGRRILNAAWAAETNRRLNAERKPSELAAIYGAPNDNPDAILLRFIAAQNAIQGGLGLNVATGGSG